MKKVLVTGATSMLGAALIGVLVEKKVRVTAVIRRGSKRRDAVPCSPLVKIVECDLADMRELKTEGGFDCCYHFAWEGAGREKRNDPEVQLQNVRATLDTVELCRRVGCKTFVGAGSQAEYGRGLGPENAYGICKKAAGELSRIMCKEHNIKHVWTRIFSTYGPNDQEGTLVSYAIANMTANKPCDFTAGEQMWDYLYCGDAAEAFYLIGQKGKPDAVYNIGSGRVQPLKNYIEIIRTVTKTESVVNYGARAYAANEVMYLCADIESLVADTGFRPRTAFSDGIRKILESVRGN